NARAEPVRAALMSHEQRAELVHAVGDLVHEDAAAFLPHPALAGELVHRKYGVVARMVRVVTGRPVCNARTVAHGVVVRDRDRFTVRDKQSVKLAFLRRPRAHFDRRAGPREIDRSLASELVLTPVVRKMLLVRAP